MRMWFASLLLLSSNNPLSYDIFAINIASTMLGYVYGKGGSLNSNQSLGVKVATPVGNIFGQVIFGWLADVVGRKRMCQSSSFFSHLSLFLMLPSQTVLN